MANDAHISGSGRLSGGDYNEVHISGSGKWDGPIHCRSFHVSGSCNGKGTLTVLEDLHCSGSFRSDSHVDTKELHISGSARVDGNVAGREAVQVSGSLRCNNLYGGDVKVSGGLDTQGDVEADEFFMTGAGEIRGLLNAEEIEIVVSGIPRVVKISQIGGSKICIRPGATMGFLSKLFSSKTTAPGAAEVGTIEGDAIELTATTADVVRGTNVTLHSGCQIKRVEYSGDLVIEGDAVVGEQVKV